MNLNKPSHVYPWPIIPHRRSVQWWQYTGLWKVFLTKQWDVWEPIAPCVWWWELVEAGVDAMVVVLGVVWLAEDSSVVIDNLVADKLGSLICWDDCGASEEGEECCCCSVVTCNCSVCGVPECGGLVTCASGWSSLCCCSLLRLLVWLLLQELEVLVSSGVEHNQLLHQRHNRRVCWCGGVAPWRVAARQQGGGSVTPTGRSSLPTSPAIPRTLLLPPLLPAHHVSLSFPRA